MQVLIVDDDMATVDVIKNSVVFQIYLQLIISSWQKRF